MTLAMPGVETLPPRSRLSSLLDPNSFVWASGIEDTFIVAPHAVTGRMLDEYDLTQHYKYWEQDLGLLAELGVSASRYGVPWYKINPTPGHWDWSWADRPLNRLLELGIHPIVDLVHYGTPAWLEGGFTSPDYPARVAEYAATLADRFKGSIRWYTPLNEPRITAWYCGRLGWWPPYARGWSGFVRVLMGVCKGVALTQRALQAVDPEIVNLHVDATDLYFTRVPELEPIVQFRQDLVFLALDMISGLVGQEHRLRPWLRTLGVSEDELNWFAENSVQPDVIGLNLYPMFTHKEVARAKSGAAFLNRHSKTGDLLERLARMYWQRYRRPLMVTETASNGTHGKRMEWLQQTIDATRTLRQDGVPMLGYTWWPLFALVGWGYRQSGRRPLDHYLVQMGLWDLVEKNTELVRVRTPVVDAYIAAVAAGSGAVGRLGVIQ